MLNLSVINALNTCSVVKTKSAKPTLVSINIFIVDNNVIYKLRKKRLQNKRKRTKSKKTNIELRGHSKGRFTQDFLVLTSPPHLPPCLSLFIFEHSPHPAKVRSFWLELTLFPSISILLKFKEKNNEYQCQYLWLNLTCLFRSHNGISIKWTPLEHDKSVRFMEMPALQRVHLKIGSLQK